MLLSAVEAEAVIKGFVKCSLMDTNLILSDTISNESVTCRIDVGRSNLYDLAPCAETCEKYFRWKISKRILNLGFTTLFRLALFHILQGVYKSRGKL